jgi:NTP pyrophosphatase (non-canonical NTP hydrolase)
VVPIAKLSQYEYEAVSYCWPEAGKSFIWTTVIIQDEGVIQIHDSENMQLRSLPLLPVSTKQQASRQDTKYKNIITTELRVSSIVFEVLDALRKENRKVTVWVDAICLDLQNQEEKRTQSLNFSEIFFQATSVTHYLSTSDGLAEFGKQFDAVDRIIGSFGTESTATSKIQRQSRLSTPYEDLLKLMNNKSVGYSQSYPK